MTDTITLGLSHAQLTSKSYKYALSWMCFSENRFDRFDIVSLAKYLENEAQPSSALSPVRLLCQRIAKLYDFAPDATILQYHDNLRRKWKQRPLKIRQRFFNKILDNPNLSLINSLLYNNFSLSKSWLPKSQDCTLSYMDRIMHIFEVASQMMQYQMQIMFDPFILGHIRRYVMLA